VLVVIIIVTATMLNARIEIVTSRSPYKVNRRMPTILDQYLTGKNDWMIFCDRIDAMLVVFEEVKAVWMVLGDSAEAARKAKFHGIYTRIISKLLVA
jgi:hypothetical protein